MVVTQNLSGDFGETFSVRLPCENEVVIDVQKTAEEAYQTVKVQEVQQRVAKDVQQTID